MSNTGHRLIAAASVVGLLFAVLLARLWQLQMVEGERYAQEALENRIREERSPSPRGIIYDRKRRPLVRNAPFYYAAVLPDAASSGETDVDAVAAFLRMEPDDIKTLLRKNRGSLVPIRLKGGLSLDDVTAIEARLSDYPSLVIEVDETRIYPYGEIGAHAVGYIGKLNPSQIRDADFRDVPRQAFIGQWGVEKMFDQVLRGTPGSRLFEADALGRKLRIIEETEPLKGQDITLSIDIELQRAAENAFGEHRGALVAVNTTTGEILALVSRPSFDPNLFSRGINYTDWVSLAENPGHPLLNRALQTQVAPGSTFKIITAVAALEDRAISPSTTFDCPGYISKGRWRFRCWARSGHGTLNLDSALAQSCDVYFYHTGEHVGIDSIARYARQFGLGKTSGLELEAERKGLVPDTAWKKRTRRESWYLGETYNASIGQGYVLATPIQMARMMAMVASNGVDYNPTITRTEYQPEPVRTLDLRPQTFAAVRKGLEDVVGSEAGTAKGVRSDIVRIAGKTGTSQVIRLPEETRLPERLIPLEHRDHAWFVAYAPAKEPEIAVAVYVEHGGGGGKVAAPMAKAVIEQYIRDSRNLPPPAPKPARQALPKASDEGMPLPPLETAPVPQAGSPEEEPMPPVPISIEDIAPDESPLMSEEVD